jgi:heptosyltransferase-2
MHVVVILPRWVGDAVMATPMLRALRRWVGPEGRLTGLMPPSFEGLFADTPWLDERIGYERRSPEASLRIPAVARRLRGMRPDVAVVVPNSLSAAALAWLSGAPRRVGWSRNLRGCLLTDRLRPRWEGWRVEPASTAEMAMALALKLGAPAEPLRLELATSSADEAEADGLLAELFPGGEGPLVILNDNSANGVARAWGADRFGDLARWLADRLPAVRLLVHCGPGDRAEAEGIVRRADLSCARGMHDRPTLPFGLSKALIRRAALVVTSDSGPRHIAAAFAVPTVVLLGPTDPRLGRSLHDRLAEVRLDLPCSPCNRPICPLQHHDCMRLLRVESVGRVCIDLLSGVVPSFAPAAAQDGPQSPPVPQVQEHSGA